MGDGAAFYLIQAECGTGRGQRQVGTTQLTVLLMFTLSALTNKPKIVYQLNTLEFDF